MSVILDYVVYLTYDLHGQWDYGNQWSDPSCLGGNCLRSHINLTETVNALSMITKAGVPSAKVVAGVTSYGRAFQMTTPGCVDAWCTYTGPVSGATPGQCTGTAGYLANAEIYDIINNGGTFTYNDDSFSNILVYNSTQWVAYMNENNKGLRTSLFQSYHLGGTTDWAVDLQADYGPDDIDSDEDSDSTAPCDFTLSFDSLADLENMARQYSVYCSEVYAVQTLSNELVGALANYTDVNNGYDTLFGYYVDYVQDMIPEALNTFMNDKTGLGNQYFECTWNTEGVNRTTQQCPFPDLELGEGTYNVYFTLKNSTGFYNDLSNNYGIDPSWIKFGNYVLSVHCTALELKNGCLPVQATWYGFPMEPDSITVPNPKDLITGAGTSMSSLQDKIDAT
jgi:chitinase